MLGDDVSFVVGLLIVMEGLELEIKWKEIGDIVLMYVKVRGKY